MAEFKKPQMSLEGNNVVEKYVGKKTSEYVGHYETDGFKCNCSWFKSKLICRHPFFYRMVHCLPLFDLKIFPSSMLLNMILLLQNHHFLLVHFLHKGPFIYDVSQFGGRGGRPNSDIC